MVTFSIVIGNHFIAYFTKRSYLSYLSYLSCKLKSYNSQRVIYTNSAASGSTVLDTESQGAASGDNLMTLKAGRPTGRTEDMTVSDIVRESLHEYMSK